MTTDANPSAAPLPAAELVIRRLEEHAKERGDQPALVGARGRTLTYAELDAWANRIANGLLAAPRTAQPVVAIAGDLRVDTVALLLGVLKSGFALAPLQPREPDERLLASAERLGARLVLADPDRAREVTAAGPRSAVAAVADVTSDDPGRPLERADANGAVLVAATSGSTGAPKTVVYGNVLEDIISHRILATGPGDRCGILQPPAWVGALMPIVSPLLVGATGICVDLATTPLSDLPRWMADVELSVIGLTPSLLRTLVDLVDADGLTLPGIERVSLSGEASVGADLRRARQVLPNATFLLGYGSTEGGVICRRELPPGEEIPDGVLRPGVPVSPMEVRADDGSGRAVPDGEVGIIVATGPRLPLVVDGEGPLDLAALDWSVDHDVAVGDVGRILPTGELEVLGRRDARVKVRGQMVDPLRVEAALAALPPVRHGIVSVVPVGSTNELVAWVVPAVDPAPQARQLRRALTRALPGFMLPSRFVLVDDLVWLPNTKPDRVELARRAATVGPARPEVVECATPTEAWLAAVLESLLGVDRVGRHDDVFELGADSLAGVELLVAISEEQGVQVDVADLIDQPTVASLAALIDERSSTGPRPGRGALVAVRDAIERFRPRDDGRRAFALRADGQRTLLYVVPGGGANLFQLRPLATALTDRPVRELVPKGVETRTSPNYTVGAAARRYVEAILAEHPADQPLLLAGSSFGASVAWEMAHQLAAAGRRPDQLVLLDPGGFPGTPKRFHRQFSRRLERTGPVRDDPSPSPSPPRPSPSRVTALHQLAARARTRSPRRLVRSALWYGRWAFRSRVPAVTVGLVRRPLARQEPLFLSVNANASRRYRPAPYDGPVVVARSTVPWSPLAGGAEPVVRLCRGDVVVVDVPGDHESMLRPPHVAVLAARLDELLLP